MQLCQPHQINLARDAFCNAGPVLRSCIDAVQPEYKALEEFVYLRGVAIRNFLRAKVVQRVDNFSRHICSMPLDNFSDMALIAVPKLPLRVTATLRHASVAVSDQLFQVLRQERGIVAAQNWGALMQVEGVGSFSAVLFEGAVRRHFLERRLLPAHGDMRVLPYKDIRGRVDFERKGLLHSAGPVFIYATLREAAHFIASHCFDNCLLVPQAKNQATFDAFSVTWIDMKTVKLTLYQVTVGASHDLKSSALHDVRELFHYSSRIPDVDKVDLRLVFIVPPTVFDKWTEAVVPHDLTANQEVSRKTRGQEVFGGNHWCRHLAQYVVCVDVNDLLQPA